MSIGFNLKKSKLVMLDPNKKVNLSFKALESSIEASLDMKV